MLDLSIDCICVFRFSGNERIQVPLRKPTSPWMPFPTLISALAKVLPPDATNLIMKHHRDNRVSPYKI